ncbi:hypothetical protein ANTPLA_LOCUS2901 [Anthophora plagiata]
MHSLIHNQLSAPRYKELFNNKYTWFRCGYISSRPEHFDNPVDFSFNQIETMYCSNCPQVVAVKCSWCKSHLCFILFFENFHYYNKYIE